MRNTGSESATVGNHCAEETLGFLSDTPASKILVSCPYLDNMLYPSTSNLLGKAGDIFERI